MVYPLYLGPGEPGTICIHTLSRIAHSRYKYYIWFEQPEEGCHRTSIKDPYYHLYFYAHLLTPPHLQSGIFINCVDHSSPTSFGQCTTESSSIETKDLPAFIRLVTYLARRNQPQSAPAKALNIFTVFNPF